MDVGFSTEDVIGAAVNVLVNGVRQAHGTREKAHEAMREKLAKALTLLDRNYGADGKRLTVLPKAQTVFVPHFVDRDGW